MPSQGAKLCRKGVAVWRVLVAASGNLPRRLKCPGCSRTWLSCSRHGPVECFGLRDLGLGLVMPERLGALYIYIYIVWPYRCHCSLRRAHDGTGPKFIILALSFILVMPGVYGTIYGPSWHSGGPRRRKRAAGRKVLPYGEAGAARRRSSPTLLAHPSPTVGLAGQAGLHGGEAAAHDCAAGGRHPGSGTEGF